MKKVEGSEYTTEQGVKLEIEIVELKAERSMMSLKVNIPSHALKSLAHCFFFSRITNVSLFNGVKKQTLHAEQYSSHARFLAHPF